MTSSIRFHQHTPYKGNEETTTTDEKLSEYLENEKRVNANTTWSKLNKAERLRLLDVYADSYATDNTLLPEEVAILKSYLKQSLDRKKLQRVKDVQYDKATGSIKSIPGLTFNKQQRKFTLKRSDKKTSTLKNLPTKKKRKDST